MTTAGRSQPGRSAVGPSILRAVAVIGLAIDAYVHLHLAPNFDPIGTSITQGGLFRAEAAAATVAAVYLLVRDSRRAWLLAGAVAVAGLAAILVTRYIQVPAIGPIPAMYDPIWYTEKVVALLAMAGTVLAWLVREGGTAMASRPRAGQSGR